MNDSEKTKKVDKPAPWRIDENAGWGAKHISFPKRMFLSGVSLGIAIGTGIGMML